MMKSQIEVFNQIAPGWYGFRHWSIFRTELEVAAQRWQQGRLLNIGCAHGPDFLPFKADFELHGADFSTEMLGLARKYATKFDLATNLVLADACHLPYADESFDWAISVATYHHIKGKAARQAALSELRRVLMPGGEAFITVWNHWQPRFWLRPREVMVPWRKRGEILYRYYYLLSYPELEGLARKAGLTVIKSFPESGYSFPLKFFSRNICLLVKKSGRETDML